MTAQVVRACVQDLEAIPGFLRANDAGMQRPISEAEQTARSDALRHALEKVQSVESEAQGTELIQQYLHAWRKTHLFVRAITRARSGDPVRPAEPVLPRAEALSASTALLVLPSFSPEASRPLQELLKLQRDMLATRRNWIIDVRGNGGGADTTFAPLLPWLMPDGWLAVSDKVFVTQANILAEEALCESFAPGDPDCIRVTQESVRRMRAAGGGWVQQEYDAGWRHVRPETVEERRPERVAILIDRGCGSSCEQFLLTLRQSFAVKLVGRERTFGALDASNLRPYLLPSRRRHLWYATTMSNRLPAMPIDGIGICPDVLLPEAGGTQDPKSDVQWAMRWLEGGAW